MSITDDDATLDGVFKSRIIRHILRSRGWWTESIGDKNYKLRVHFYAVKYLYVEWDTGKMRWGKTLKKSRRITRDECDILRMSDEELMRWYEHNIQHR